jgi:glycosyltransferase involved in cell wall biosynthesis
MKKILIATGVYPPESGGPATNTKLLEDTLPARGFTVSVLPFRTVRHLPIGVRHLAYMLRLKSMARQADCVYAQDAVSVGLPAVLVAKWLHKPLIVRVPGDYAWEQGRARFSVKESLDEFKASHYGWRVRLLHYIQCYVLKHTWRVIAPGSYLQKHIISWGVPSERVVLIHNGIEIPVLTEAPSERPNGFLVVSIGRRVPWKGFEALERVVAREKDWHLKIAETLSRSQALGWAKAADVFVLNSGYEGLSHTLLEVMSLGVPIVATNIGGNPELIENEKHGLLIPAENDEALYTALKWLKENPEEARHYGAAAKQRAEEFTIEKTVGKLVELLNVL